MAAGLRGDRVGMGCAPVWQQLVDFRVRMIGYAVDDVWEPGLWIHIVHSRGLDQRVNDGGAAAAFIRAGE
jgi:hypothetical protein